MVSRPIGCYHLHEGQEPGDVLVFGPDRPPVMFLQTLLKGRVVDPDQGPLHRVSRGHQVEEPDGMGSSRLRQVPFAGRVTRQVRDALVRVGHRSDAETYRQRCRSVYFAFFFTFRKKKSFRQILFSCSQRFSF